MERRVVKRAHFTLNNRGQLCHNLWQSSQRRDDTRHHPTVNMVGLRGRALCLADLDTTNFRHQFLRQYMTSMRMMERNLAITRIKAGAIYRWGMITIFKMMIFWSNHYQVILALRISLHRIGTMHIQLWVVPRIIDTILILSIWTALVEVLRVAASAALTQRKLWWVMDQVRHLCAPGIIMVNLSMMIVVVFHKMLISFSSKFKILPRVRPRKLRSFQGRALKLWANPCQDSYQVVVARRSIFLIMILIWQLRVRWEIQDHWELAREHRLHQTNKPILFLIRPQAQIFHQRHMKCLDHPMCSQALLRGQRRTLQLPLKMHRVDIPIPVMSRWMHRLIKNLWTKWLSMEMKWMKTM